MFNLALKKVSVVEMQSILYIKLLRIGCRVGLRVLSGIAVGRWHSKSPRALLCGPTDGDLFPILK